MPQHKDQTRPTLWKFILGLTMLLWGSNYIVSGSLLQDYSAQSVLAFRLITATLVLLLVSVFKKDRLAKIELDRDELILLAASGLSGVLMASYFFMLGIQLSGPSLSAILTNTNPLMVAMLALLLGIEKLGPRKLLGLLLGIAGVMIVILHDSSGPNLSPESLKGALFSLLAALGISINAVLGKKHLIPKLGSFNYTLLTLLPSALIVGVWLLVSDPSSLMIHNTSDGLKIIYLGAITTATVWLLFAESMKHLDASEATTFKLLIAPSAALLSFLFFEEALSWIFYAGMVVILLGLFLVGKPRS